MTFPQLTRQLCLCPGTGGVNFIASGNIIKGQGVTFAGDNSVKVPTDTSSYLVGIAHSTVYHNDIVCVYCIGNIVYCMLSGSQGAGTKVGVISDGYLSDTSQHTPSIVLEGVTSTGKGKILILG